MLYSHSSSHLAVVACDSYLAFPLELVMSYQLAEGSMVSLAAFSWRL